MLFRENSTEDPASMDVTEFFVHLILLSFTSLFCFIFSCWQHRVNTLLAGFEDTHRKSSGNTQVSTHIQNWATDPSSLTCSLESGIQAWIYRHFRKVRLDCISYMKSAEVKLNLNLVGWERVHSPFSCGAQVNYHGACNVFLTLPHFTFQHRAWNPLPLN